MSCDKRLTFIASAIAFVCTTNLIQAAPVSVPAGSIFMNGLQLNDAQGTIGESTGSPVLIWKGTSPAQAALTLDAGNIAILNTQISDNTTGGIGVIINKGPLTTGSAFTFDNTTRISGGASGMQIFNSGIITLNGTQVNGGESGIYIGGAADIASPGSTSRPVVNLNNTTVSGGSVGVRVEDNADLFIQGGSISGDMAGVKVSSTGPDANVTATITQGARITSADGAALVLAPRLVSDVTQKINVSLENSVLEGETWGLAVTPENDSQATSSITLSGTQVSGKLAAIGIGENAGVVSLLLKDNTTLNSDSGTALITGKDTTANVTVQNDAIAGEIINNGTTSLILNNGGTWQGSTQTLSQLQLKSGGRWDVTDTSVVQGDVTNGGTLSLARGNTTGNTLTVNGNYTGNSGLLRLNTALGGDASATDRLVIQGDTSGTTRVSVQNAGGTGAQTLNGIELIDVGGNSGGTFTQEGRIVAGAYDYSLVRGSGANSKDWMLTSRITDPDNTDIVTPNVVRPEAGSYIANQTASFMFLTTLHDRAGENRYINALNSDGEATSLWLRQVGMHNQFRDGSGQLKTTGNTYVAQLGGDLVQWSSSDHDRYHLGLMAGYGNNSNSTHSKVSGHGSKGSVDGYSVGMYGTWYQNDKDKTGAYVDGQVMYSWFNNHVNGDSISAESYKSKGVTASAETGYTFALGQSGAQDNPTRYFIEPQAQVTWMGVKADDLTETNGTTVSSRGNNNIQTRLGMRAFLQGHSRIDNGTDRSFQPFVEVNWLHNTKRNGVDMNGVAVEQAGATNLGEIKLGVEGKITHSVQLWGNVAQDVGSQGYSNSVAMVGVKYAF